MHVGMSAIFQGFGGSLVGPGGVGGRPPSRRSRRAARLRVDLERRAPLHGLHDVSRRAAVPDLHGGPHEHGEAGLDGAGAAVARPGAGRRADRDARPHVQRPADPRTRPGHRQGRVRRVPRRDGVRPPAVQGSRRGHPRRARDRRHGVPRRVRRSAAGGAPPVAAGLVQGPDLLGDRLARVGRDHGQARHRCPDRAPEAVAHGQGGDGDVPLHVSGGDRRGAAAADRRRVDLRRRERRPRRGAGPHVVERVLGLGHLALRVRQAAPQVDAGLRVPRPHVRPAERARRRGEDDRVLHRPPAVRDAGAGVREDEVVLRPRRRRRLRRRVPLRRHAAGRRRAQHASVRHRGDARAEGVGAGRATAWNISEPEPTAVLEPLPSRSGQARGDGEDRGLATTCAGVPGCGRGQVASGARPSRCRGHGRVLTAVPGHTRRTGRRTKSSPFRCSPSPAPGRPTWSA